MPRYRVIRRIEQETTIMADDEQQAEEIARSLHNLEWEDTGFVELEAEYDLKDTPFPQGKPGNRSQLN